MRSPRRRLCAVVAAPLLVLSLAACVPEPEAAPEPPPTVEPVPTETAATPTPPGSRVPATCEQLFAGLAGFAGGPAARVDLDYLPNIAVLAQAGYEFCRVPGMIGGTPVTITTVVGVDIARDSVQKTVDAADEFGLPTGVGGELSYTECTAASDFSYCSTGVYANGYLIEFTIVRDGAIAADFDSSLRRLTVDLGERAESWPAAVPAWIPPPGALTWANDCEGEVVASDAAIRVAMPFDPWPPTFFGSGDGYPLFYKAEELQSTTHCEWSSSGDDFGSASISITPGAAWIVEAGATLPGTPIDYPGALAASVVDNPEYSNVSVWVVIDNSIVIVDMDTGYLIDDRPGEIDAALEVVDAIVAEFGAP